MPAKLGICFLGVTVGGATFLAVGFACFLMITQLQYSTLQARAAQAALDANQVSTRAKNAPIMADAIEVLRRELAAQGQAMTPSEQQQLDCISAVVEQLKNTAK